MRTCVNSDIDHIDVNVIRFTCMYYKCLCLVIMYNVPVDIIINIILHYNI